MTAIPLLWFFGTLFLLLAITAWSVRGKKFSCSVIERSTFLSTFDKARLIAEIKGVPYGDELSQQQRKSLKARWKKEKSRKPTSTS